MSPREHAALARGLIEACGGLLESERHCRLGKSLLGQATDPQKPYTLPADVIVDLETYCGERIYSRPLFETGPNPAASGDIMAAAVEVNVCASKLLAGVQEANKDGVISPRERSALIARVVEADKSIADVKAELGETK